MICHPRRSGAVLLSVVLTATASACAPIPNPAPVVSIPATLPMTPTSPDTVGPTATATPFAPTPVPTGRTGTPAGGMPPALTLASGDPDVVAAAGLTAYYRADTALDLGPADTHRRALPWTTGQLAGDIRGDRPVTGPDATWTCSGRTPRLHHPHRHPRLRRWRPYRHPDDGVLAVHRHRHSPRPGRLVRVIRHTHRLPDPYPYRQCLADRRTSRPAVVAQQGAEFRGWPKVGSPGE